MASYQTGEKHFSQAFLEAYARVENFIEQKKREGSLCYQIIATSNSKNNQELRPCAIFLDGKKNIIIYDGITNKEYRSREIEKKLGIIFTAGSRANFVWCSDTVLEIGKARELLAMFNALSKS